MKNKNEDVGSKKKEYLIDDPHFEHWKKGIKDMEKIISDVVPDFSKILEPVQEQIKSLSMDIPLIKASLFTEEQQKMLTSASKGISAKINILDMQKRASFFTEEQLEIFKSASKGLGFKMPDLPKSSSLFTPAQQRILKSVGKGLNLGLDRLPKMATIFTAEQQQILGSTGKMLNLKINNLPKTASYFSSEQRSMLQSIATGLNISASHHTQVVPAITIDDFVPYWEDEEVQQTIKQEISALEGVESEKKLKDHFDNWATKVLDFPSSLREKSPFVYLILRNILFVISVSFIPAIEDVIKETVWHVSDFIEEKKEVKSEEKPKAQVKELKTNVLLNYPDAEHAMNYIRVTNRETLVYRSGQRKSGKIGTIQPNKPVIILHKKKNWSLVLYRDSNKQEVEGWVFTKNLIK
ncbi:hypothetical protein [Priestia sp. YIM B13490]|uniref:hypothetical protein n=1 Tax=Priestia sp. YIM B13490 TaxID=3366310 RepID=UPI003670C254